MRESSVTLETDGGCVLCGVLKLRTRTHIRLPCGLCYETLSLSLSARTCIYSLSAEGCHSVPSHQLRKSVVSRPIDDMHSPCPFIFWARLDGSFVIAQDWGISLKGATIDQYIDPHRYIYVSHFCDVASLSRISSATLEQNAPRCVYLWVCVSVPYYRLDYNGVDIRYMARIISSRVNCDTAHSRAMSTASLHWHSVFSLSRYLITMCSWSSVFSPWVVREWGDP